jgi:hypothetical protein
MQGLFTRTMIFVSLRVARHEAIGNLQIGLVLILAQRCRRHGELSLCENTPLDWLGLNCWDPHRQCHSRNIKKVF